MSAKRVVLDCRSKPEVNCSLAMSGSEEEVLDVAEYHVTAKHGFKKDPGLREQLKSYLKPESGLGERVMSFLRKEPVVSR